MAARRALGLEEEGEVVAILPGSRRSEVQYLARRFFDAAVLGCGPQAPWNVRFVVPAVPALRESDCRACPRGRRAERMC